LGERVLCKHEVTGSIPVSSTNNRFASLSEVGRQTRQPSS